MSLFVRSLSCTRFQCMRRMAQDFFGTDSMSKKHLKFSNKRIDSQIIANNDIIINNKLRNSEKIVDDHWVEIRKELLETYMTRVSESTIDSLIYDLCNYHKRLDEAKNYFKFLERNNYNLSLSTLGRYLRFLSESEITEAEEQEIYKIYDHIRKKYSLLDSKTCTNCILALCITKRWNEAFKLLDMLLLSDIPGMVTITALCNAAFKNNKPELAWKLMNEHIQKFSIAHSVYLEYLKYCKRNFEGQNLIEEIEKIFYFWRDNLTTPVDFVMVEYMKTFSTLGYETSFSTLYKEEKCMECHNVLQRSTLSEEEFKILSQSVLKKLIIGKNIYQSSSPHELKMYMNFIKNMQSYDIIIDGLNVAYASVINNRGSLDNVLKVVNSLFKENKKILVIGRKHMKYWSTETMRRIEQKADVFLVQNLSQDDPFLLHLALISGPQTYFVSRDLMRQHMYKLQDKNLEKLFNRWQLSRQYMFMRNAKTQAEILLPPASIETNAQKAGDRWHIPCTRNVNIPQPKLFTVPELWVCISKKETLKK